MGTLKDIYDILVDLIDNRFPKRHKKKPTGSDLEDETSNVIESRGANGITWEQYDRLFDMEGYRVSYIPIINNWKGDIAFLDHGQVAVNKLSGKFKLPKELMTAPIPSDAYDGSCCRLSDYTFKKDTLNIDGLVKSQEPSIRELDRLCGSKTNNGP